jgi:hypothetical protein
MTEVAERGLRVGLVERSKAKPAQAKRRSMARHNYQMPGQAGHDNWGKPGMTKEHCMTKSIE